MPFTAHWIFGLAFSAALIPTASAAAHRDLACTIAAGGCDAVIGSGSGVIWIRESDPPPAPLTDYAGKTLCIRNGTYSGIWLEHVIAAEAAPLTITNCGGQVVSKPPAGQPANPIAIGKYSRYIRLSGTGSIAHTYGLVAWSIHPEQHMIDIAGGASDVALEYLEIRGNDSGGVAAQLTGGVGISYKTYPNCTTGEFTAANWALHGVDIEHVYVHDTLREGMYIGPSHYGSIPANGYTPGWACPGGVVLAEAPVLGLAIIRDNRVENIGNDAIQLSAAIDGFAVENNVVRNYGLNVDSSHSAGIQIGTGSIGIANANWIENAQPRQTQGIKHGGNGDTWYTNNIIAGAADGIMLLRNSDVNVGLDLPVVHVYHNTVVGSSSIGMSYWCNYNKVIRAANNLIASGQGVPHAAGGEQGSSCFDQALLTPYNGFFGSVGAAQFVAPAELDFRLLPNSPAVGAGFDLSGSVATDFLGATRTAPFDFGAIGFADLIFASGFD